jgi:serine/threonine protein phosphatase 1
MIKYINKNEGRLFIVGDIHGMYTMLENLLIEIKFNKEKDLLISVGDLIDRGKESYRTLEFLKEEWFESVLGNHEVLLMDYIEYPEGDSENFWESNGGMWDKPDNIEYEDYYKIFTTLPLIIEINFKGKKIGINHTGVPYYFSDWKDYKYELENGNLDVYENTLWDRTKYKECAEGETNYINNIDLIVSGHTIGNSTLMLENSLFIDTGAFKKDPNFNFGRSINGKLTIVEINVENEILKIKENSI